MTAISFVFVGFGPARRAYDEAVACEGCHRDGGLCVREECAEDLGCPGPGCEQETCAGDFEFGAVGMFYSEAGEIVVGISCDSDGAGGVVESDAFEEGLFEEELAEAEWFNLCYAAGLTYCVDGIPFAFS